MAAALPMSGIKQRGPNCAKLHIDVHGLLVVQISFCHLLGHTNWRKIALHNNARPLLFAASRFQALDFVWRLVVRRLNVQPRNRLPNMVMWAT